MATKINQQSFSEDEFGQKIDRCLTDTLVKAGTISLHYIIGISWTLRILITDTFFSNKICRRWSGHWRRPFIAVFQATSVSTVGRNWLWSRRWIQKLRTRTQLSKKVESIVFDLVQQIKNI